MKMMMTTTKTMIKSKTENESLPSCPSYPTNPNVHPPTTHTPPCNPRLPPQLWALLWGKTVPDGWAEWSCIPPTHPFLFLLSPMELRATQHPPPHPNPRPRGSQAARHSAFHNFTVKSLFMYSRVRTLGLVSSFGSVLLIFCWMKYFLLLGLLFLILCILFFIFFRPLLSPPNKIIAIAAVQPASHDFFVWPPVAQIKVVATFLLSVWQENNFVNKMLTFYAFLSSFLAFLATLKSLCLFKNRWHSRVLVLHWNNHWPK